MSHITGLRLTNWMRYRGLVELALEPKPYAIVAEWDGDPSRSNWGGKSSLAWAILFALKGCHPHRTKDEWITDGEREGGVDVELSDGVFVSRTRVRGGSDQLRVIVPQPDGSEKEAHGEDAQVLLDEVLGFTLKDARATWWVEQGRLAVLATTEGSGLNEVVSEWLGFGKIEAAEEYASEQANKSLVQVANLEYGADQRRRELAAIVLGDREELVRARDASAEAAKVAGKGSPMERRSEWLRDQDAAVRHSTLKQELASLTEPPDVTEEDVSKASEAWSKAVTASQSAAGDVRAKRVLARGEFDGKCPVGGIACPAKDELNRDVKTNQNLLKLAQDAALALESATRTAKSAYDFALRGQRAWADWDVRRERIEREIAELAPAAERFKTLGDEPSVQDLHRAIAQAQEDEARLQAHDREQARADGLREALAADEQRLLEQRALATAWREAAQVLGRNGVQRVIAAQVLGEMQERANAVLAACGIDLQVSIQWAREGKDPARQCYECGAAFPRSHAVKVCPECEAPRGRQRQEKMSIQVSEKSGGALDLAGALTQLAAAAWLRHRRGYDWAVVVVDEPFGSLDPHNRSHVAAKLAGALRTEFGAEQAFVIAHDEATLSAMPGRIRVSATASGSTAVVE